MKSAVSGIQTLCPATRWIRVRRRDTQESNLVSWFTYYLLTCPTAASLVVLVEQPALMPVRAVVTPVRVVVTPVPPPVAVLPLAR